MISCLITNMSLLASGVFANPTQPLWAPYGSGGSAGPTGPTGPAGGGGGSNPTFDTVTFTTTSNAILSDRIDIGSNVYNGAQQVAIVNSSSNILGPLQVGNLVEVQSGASLPNQALPRMLYQSDSVVYQQENTGVTFPIFSVAAGPPPAIDFTNVRSITPASTGFVSIPGIVQATTYSVDITSNQVQQPKIQYGRVDTAGSSGVVTVNMGFAYTSDTTYIVQATMEDTTPAQISVLRSTADSFNVFWAGASGLTNNAVYWTAFGY